MQRATARLWTRRHLVVLAAPALVHAHADETLAAGKRKSSTTATIPAPDGLTAGVREMLELIRSAIRERDIDSLRDAIDWNEMKPDFDTPGVTDPVAHWKAQSKDGTGQETLDLLASLLAGEPAIVPYGRDLENNRMFVWPRFAEGVLKPLAGTDLEQFQRLVAPADRDPMITSGSYTGWRLVLGADGTWHTFRPR